MGFTKRPLTSHSQQDGVIINCRSLRVWTPLGTHFKRARRFCLLGLDLAWQTDGLWPNLCFMAAHLAGSTLAEIETLCFLMFSHDIFINALHAYPRTSIIFLHTTPLPSLPPNTPQTPPTTHLFLLLTLPP